MKETTETWADGIGQEIHPGDYVAISTVNDKSPQLVVAQVLSINLTNKDGKSYVKWRPGWPAVAADRAGGYQHIEAVTISAIPVFNSRGFWRSGKQRAVTYTVTENMIKLSEEQVETIKAKIDAAANTTK